MSKRVHVIIIVLLLAAASLYSLQLSPTVNIIPASPSTIYVGQPTTVLIRATISDSRVISTGVNLLQIDPHTGTQTVVGNLNVTSEHLFTIVLQPSTASPQLLTYRVSAAFRGLLRRSLSLPITVAVAPRGVVLPPDPGPDGMQTLVGVDSDHDGVRDDVQRWIAVTYTNSAAMRSALTQYSKALQVLMSSNDVVASMKSVLRAQYCSNYTEYLLHRDDYSYKMALQMILNTYPRAHAFYKADSESSGHFFGVPQSGQELSACDLNPTTLPN